MNQSFESKWIDIANKATDDYETLSSNERVWVNIRVLIDSINNGGLISYYYNSGAENVYDLIEDIKVIKMTPVVDIIGNYNNVLFPKTHVPKDIHERNVVIDDIDDKTNYRIQQLENEIFRFVPELENQLDKFLLENFK